MKQRDKFFDEDFVDGAVASLQVSLRRLKWRIGSGEWPNEPVGKFRQMMEDQIEQLIEHEVERHRLGEITPTERTGPVVHRRRKGQMRMRPLK